MTTKEKGDPAPLVATHAADVAVSVNGASAGESITVPPEVRVIAKNSSAIALVVPSAPSLPVSVSWQQERSDGSQCSASSTTALPVGPASPARTLHIHNSRAFSSAGHRSFVVIPTQRTPNLDPLEISIRLTTAVRFPSQRAKARKMAVPMRVEDQIKYRTRLPNLAYASTRTKCRLFLLTCGNTVSAVAALNIDDKALRRGIERPDLDGNNAIRGLLARTQPFLASARYGLEVSVYGASERKLRRGYDVQVRQTGRLIGRLRRAERCRVVRKFGGTRAVCRAVRQSTKLN